jgi:hypothetical protein
MIYRRSTSIAATDVLEVPGDVRCINSTQSAAYNACMELGKARKW